VIDGGGIFKDSAGNIYEGELKDSVPHGAGNSKDEELEYVGNFENGKRKGFGFLISDTDAYFGEFDNDQANGRAFWRMWKVAGIMASLKTTNRTDLALIQQRKAAFIRDSLSMVKPMDSFL
jgi:hypothetical protein